jgi:hypothetical protein
MFARQQPWLDSRAGARQFSWLAGRKPSKLAGVLWEENSRVFFEMRYGRPAEMAAGWRASISTKRAKSFSLKVRMRFTPCTSIAATRRAS